MKKTKKALASLALAGMALTTIPFNAFANGTVPTRLAGVTAEQTAVQIADQTGYTGAAILASSTSYGMVDALTAGPLAASLKAPILLTGAGTTLDAATKAELTKLEVKTVYVTSGTAVIKQGVIDELKAMGIEVVALGGFDRAETSVNIAKKMTGVTKVAVANTVVDALSIAAVASAANEPILLTDRDALPASVAAYLASAGVTTTDVIGGTGVISDAVVAGLPGATRHFGMTAYDTNNQVIQDFAAALQFDNVYVANGVTGIDALAGAPLAAQTKSPIVLTDGQTVPAAAAFTYSKSSASTVVTALGGTAVVPESVRTGIAAGQVTPETGNLAIVSVSALTNDGHVLAVNFNKEPGSINKADVKIYNSSSLERVGVESVLVSGNVAEITLYDIEGADEIKALTNYTIEVNGVKFQFMRSAFLGSDSKARVASVDFEKKTMKVSSTAGSQTLNVPAALNIDLQEALGQEINVWYNTDHDITNYAYVGNKVLYSGVEVTKTLSYDGDGDVKNGEIKLNETGDVLKFADQPVFYNNNASLTTTDAVALLQEDVELDFAKIVLDSNGNVAYMSAFDWDNVDVTDPAAGNPLVVDKVDGTVVIGYDIDQDLEDYTVIKNGKIIAISDIKQGDIVYYNDAEEFAEVYDSTVTAKIDAVYKTEIEVDGNLYKYLNSSLSELAVYLNEKGDSKDFDQDAAEQMMDAGEDVVLHFDRNGDLVFVSGVLGQSVTSSSAVILTETVDYWADSRDKAQMELEYVDANGDSALKSFSVADLDKVTVNGTTYEVDETFNGTKIDKFALSGTLYKGQYLVALDANGKVINLTGTSGTVSRGSETAANYIYDLTTVLFGTALEVGTDDEGNVVELEFFTNTQTIVASDELESGDKYYAAKKINSDTKVFNIEEGTFSSGVLTDLDSDEVSVMNWEDLAEDTMITAGTAYFNNKNEVEYFIVSSDNANDTTNYKALVTKVVYNTDDEIVSIKAFVNGTEKTYVVDNKEVPGIAKGDSVKLTVSDSSGVVTGISEYTATTDIFKLAEVVDYDSNEDTLTVTTAEGPNATFDILSDTIVYDATSSTYKIVSLSELTKMEASSDTRKVTILLDNAGSSFVKFIVITN